MKARKEGDGEWNGPALVREIGAETDSETDAEVKYKIYKALREAAQLEAQNISVQRLGGKVILRGVAKSWAEREEIERAAGRPMA